MQGWAVVVVVVVAGGSNGVDRPGNRMHSAHLHMWA